MIVEATIDGETVLVMGCSSTLIAPDVVLTAAHCVHADVLEAILGGQASDVAFHVTNEADLTGFLDRGSTTLPADAVRGSVVVSHADYVFVQDPEDLPNGPGQLNDIALLFLDEPIQSMDPTTVLAPDEVSAFTDGAPIDIVGWGSRVADPEQPDAETQVGLRHCARSFINEVGASEFQVGGDESSARKCAGDSGGSSYLEVGGAFPGKRVVGITSRVYAADVSPVCIKGGIDTRVDAYYGWLDAHMRAKCTDGSRAWCDYPGVLPPDWSPDRPPELDAGIADSGTVDSGVENPTPADAGVGADAAVTTDGEGCTCVTPAGLAGPRGVAVFLATLLLGGRLWGGQRQLLHRRRRRADG